MKPLTTEEFITKAKLIHGDKYDYSKVDYKSGHIKIEIICPEHGSYIQDPYNHLKGKRCFMCSCNRKQNKLSTDEFIEKAKLIHGDKYDYSNTLYLGGNKKVKIICKIHGEFNQQASSHLQGTNCMKCNGHIKLTTEEFITKAKLIHGDKYDYSMVDYKNTDENVKIICIKHGCFEQKPDSHIRVKTGCPICSGNIKLTTEEYIKRAKIVHGDKYDYKNVYYKNAKNNIEIICLKHGSFYQNPDNHIRVKTGCPKCTTTNFSKKQIEWLELMSSINNIYIKHALNEGEYKIPDTKYKADGYCKETNTIYEFHGDFWHGNPKKYNENDINKKTNCTFKELYDNTLIKENNIKILGYKLVKIWEKDWDNFLKFIKKVQLKYKKKYSKNL